MPKAIDLTDTSLTYDISTNELQGLVTRYENERYSRLLNYINDDSRAIWIGKTAIEKFFANNANSDGLRIYFGVIDDTHRGFEQGVHNLVFVSTKKTQGTDQDQLGNDDCVIVVKNIVGEQAVPPQAVICPPPKEHCNGNGLVYSEKP